GHGLSVTGGTALTGQTHYRVVQTVQATSHAAPAGPSRERPYHKRAATPRATPRPGRPRRGRPTKLAARGAGSVLPAPRGNNPAEPSGDPRGVAVMTQAADTRSGSDVSHNPLNSDGRRHPLENGLTVFTLVAGLVSFATGWVVSLHFLASVTGIAALLVGLYAQLISATRPERMVIVTGLVAAFVGVSLGIAHGGFAI